MGVCVHLCVYVCVCVCVGVGANKALQKALVYMILLSNYNVMGAVNVVMLYQVIVSDATNEFLSGDSQDLLN